MFYFAIIAVLLICCTLWFVSKKNKHNPDVTQSYSSEAGDFEIKGRKGRFVIRKNNSVEFLVEDGKITAVKDLKKSNKFVYYREGDK